MTPGPRSVDRALALLDLVAEADGPVGAKELARRAGVSLSTAYHLLGPLTERGHVVRAPGGYVLGHRAPALHRAFRRQLGGAPDVAGLLLAARRATGAEAYFSTYRGGRIAVIDSTAPVTDTTDPFTPGPETRAHATAHGKVLLASLPRRERARYLADHGMARFTDRTITSAERFEAEAVRVRGGGVAVSMGEADPAYTCLAVPLPEGHALSVALPTREFRARHGALRAALLGLAGA
ncbi:IclR family transcriptional regulator [Streptomyces sp. NPDC050504]|uniref:IclR family transcriptional regulator n=1 Tax=Streptomyces sp. NPDC050504 TaxID=3365618 RepID=UPI0037A18ACF